MSQQTQTEHTTLANQSLAGHICSCASSPHTHIPILRPCVVHPSAPTRRIDRAAMDGWLSRRYCTQQTHSRPLSDRHQHPTQQQQDPKPTSKACRPACCVHDTGKQHKKQRHHHAKRAWVYASAPRNVADTSKQEPVNAPTAKLHIARAAPLLLCNSLWTPQTQAPRTITPRRRVG